jgi:hypothetical protein
MPQQGDDEYYSSFYKKNDIYWGLGLECETYIASNKSIERFGKDIQNNLKRERYSVDYIPTFDKEDLSKILKEVFEDEKLFYIPELINSHAFTKMDRNDEHKTVYSKDTRNNTKFFGKSVFDEWLQHDEEIGDMYMKNFLFDGDTIEFRTTKFYKVTVNDIIHEYKTSKMKFINNLNKFLSSNNIWTSRLPLTFPEFYPSIAVMATNPKNNVFFNNGTFHINITLPTKLDSNGKIEDLDNFIDIHHISIKYIQWIIPLLISCFGSPDILSLFGKYSRGSLRMAISRYIGLGTYNPNKITPGKQMGTTISNINTNKDIWWQEKIKNKLNYNLPDNTGYDINFFKHYQHGIEIRIFDAFPTDHISDIFGIIILLLERVLSLLKSKHSEVIVASNCDIWNQMIERILVLGPDSFIPKNHIKKFSKVLNYPSKSFRKCNSYKDLATTLFSYLLRDHNNGYLTSLMFPNIMLSNISLNDWYLAFNFRLFLPNSTRRLFTLWSLYEILQSRKESNITDFLNVEQFYIKVLILLDIVSIKNNMLNILINISSLEDFQIVCKNKCICWYSNQKSIIHF